jgi:hypothetical protein
VGFVGAASVDFKESDTNENAQKFTNFHRYRYEMASSGIKKMKTNTKSMSIISKPFVGIGFLDGIQF